MPKPSANLEGTISSTVLNCKLNQGEIIIEQGKKVNWVEKDKDLLQMVIGGTQCNSCHLCKEVSHTTQSCPQNVKQYAATLLVILL